MFTVLGTKIQLEATMLTLVSCFDFGGLQKASNSNAKDKEQALAVQSHAVCQK